MEEERKKRRRGPRTKGRGRDIRGRKREGGGGWKRMEKDEEDEEGDHGSIVAFRIPCRPSVDFRPLPLYSPLQLLQPTCTPCISPPPFVPSTIVPVIPQSPLLFSFPRTIPATRTRPSTLDRRRVLAPSMCTRRYAGPDPPTRHQILFSPRLLFPPRPRSSPHLVLLSISRVQHFRPLCLLLSFSLPLAAFPAAASEGEARAAQSRSVA